MEMSGGAGRWKHKVGQRRVVKSTGGFGQESSIQMVCDIGWDKAVGVVRCLGWVRGTVVAEKDVADEGYLSMLLETTTD